ncbi:Ribonuclease H-like domain containing protein [Quillaja saponaria]|uniref:Ribonuclease H-like domain containing protein n=1 Tax=Quillaja saponaria TaxID=32244 RepID=A0AAD7LQZ1_QUISA|nr:Ribonuclease H-like domain containing protein [Quillaja saponaria]
MPREIDRKEQLLFASIALDRVWWLRNQCHRSDQATLPDLARWTFNVINSFVETAATCIPRPSPTILSSWSSPPNWLKIYFDGATNSAGSWAAAVCIDCTGSLKDLKVTFTNCKDPLKAEAGAALLAASLGLTMDPLLGIMLEGDSQLLVHAINSDNLSCSWCISPLIADSLSVLNGIKLWVCRKIPRGCNVLAHGLARKAAKAAPFGSLKLCNLSLDCLLAGSFS